MDILNWKECSGFYFKHIWTHFWKGFELL